MNRYVQLKYLCEHYKPQTIIEIGTWKGDRAAEMTAQSINYHDKVTYYGFDLFEDATAETDAAELNVKPHYEKDSVKEAIDKALDNPNISINLIKGNTNKTLRPFVRSIGELARPILVFIDGGHSTKTIASDYEAIARLKPEHVILDDFYTEDHEKKCPDRRKFGCNRLMDRLVKEGVKTTVLPGTDGVKDGGCVQMLLVSDEDPPEFQVNKEVRVITKNAVSDEQLQENLEYSLSIGYPQIKHNFGNRHTAVMLSAGPSLDSQREKIELLAELEDHFLICVKNSHDKIIYDWGITPWACVLLDPRPHVQEFIQNPHPDVKYITASQVDRTTIDQLMRHDAHVELYNAVVGWDGENEFYAERELMGIAGGSTAATRGLYVMQALGFRHFRLFGYDSCFAKKPPKSMFSEKRNAKRAMAMNVGGKKFYTTSELWAQVQDFEHFASTGLDFRLYGDGMLGHVYSKVNEGRGTFSP